MSTARYGKQADEKRSWSWNKQKNEKRKLSSEDSVEVAAAQLLFELPPIYDV